MPVEIALSGRTICTYIRLVAPQDEGTQRFRFLLDISNCSLIHYGTAKYYTMRVYNSLALCTLVVNWSLTLLAFIAVIVVYCQRLAARSRLDEPDDILLLVSFVVGIVLVSLSTWGILDEGQANHQANVSGSQLERAAKVSHGPGARLHSQASPLLQ